MELENIHILDTVYHISNIFYIIPAFPAEAWQEQLSSHQKQPFSF